MNCKDQHPNVAEDDHNCRDDEAEDEVVINRQPTVATGPIAAHLDWVKAHVFNIIVLIHMNKIKDDRDKDNAEWGTVTKDVKFPP